VLPQGIPNDSLLDTIATDDFLILNGLLQYTGLNAMLDLETTVATFFAPNDNAFNALGEDAIAYYFSNITVTTKLLLGHLVRQQVVPSEEVDTGSIALQSAAGETITFQRNESFYFINKAKVVKRDLLAYNGIVHVLDTVIDVPGTKPPLRSPSTSDMPTSIPTQKPSQTPLSRPPSTVTNTTFREIINSNPDFSTLGQALDALAVDLFDFDNPVTFFAPNNDAFLNLDPTFFESLLSPGWSTHLVNVLLAHLVDGAIRSSSLVDGDLRAINGQVLTVSVGATIEISSSGTTSGAVVTLPEILSEDGVFYELNDVLLPTFATRTVSDILNSTDLSLLNELLRLTGLDQLFAARRRMQANGGGTGRTFTVFAPNNDAFNARGADALDFYRSNPDVAKTLLSGHIVLDQVVSTRELDDGPVELTSLSGDTLTFMSDFKDDGSLVYTVNGVEVVMTDLLANDGIVQVISSVLSVPGTDPPERPSEPPSPVALPPSPVARSPPSVASLPSQPVLRPPTALGSPPSPIAPRSSPLAQAPTPTTGFNLPTMPGSPSQTLSFSPSQAPSSMPSDIPSFIPSEVPSFTTSDMPSISPSAVPSFTPSEAPSFTPSQMPSPIPVVIPPTPDDNAPSPVASNETGRGKSMDSKTCDKKGSNGTAGKESDRSQSQPTGCDTLKGVRNSRTVRGGRSKTKTVTGMAH
jgi:uncharacterized surface protein with fasciclin (FAS1) repeats